MVLLKASRSRLVRQFRPVPLRRIVGGIDRSGQLPHPVLQRSQVTECPQCPARSHASWRVMTVGRRMDRTGRARRSKYAP